MNGPQINDNAYVAHAGLKLDKYFKTGIGPLVTSVSIGGTRYFYEIDDEPAKDQTATVRELLDHEGNGMLFKIEVEYRPGKNRINLSASHVRAKDERQDGDYKRTEFEASLSHSFSKSTECSLHLTATEHEYEPKPLVHDDILYTSGVSCSHSF